MVGNAPPLLLAPRLRSEWILAFQCQRSFFRARREGGLSVHTLKSMPSRDAQTLRQRCRPHVAGPEVAQAQYTTFHFARRQSQVAVTLKLVSTVPFAIKGRPPSSPTPTPNSTSNSLGVNSSRLNCLPISLENFLIWSPILPSSSVVNSRRGPLSAWADIDAPGLRGSTCMNTFSSLDCLIDVLSLTSFFIVFSR